MSGGRWRQRAAWTFAAAASVLASVFLMNCRPKPTPTSPTTAEPERVAAARERCGAQVSAEFAKAGIQWPAQEILLRGMKRERQLEVWARNGAEESFRLVKTLPVLAASGQPGPKRREGDLQVPEGFYEVDRFNPLSAFHLSLGLNYPNESDLMHADPTAPGSDIFIHGGAVSVGCLALGDEAIEELYLAANDSKMRPIRVQLFPARMDTTDWPAWRDGNLEKHPDFRMLWNLLESEWVRFGRERR